MPILDLSLEKQSYSVKVCASLLFECALGIAAVTYTEIRDTLERTTSEWDEIILRLQPEAKHELDYCAKHNTWQALLRLIHGSNSTDINEFLDYLSTISVEEFRYQVLPPLEGIQERDIRRKALTGDSKAVAKLIEAAASHNFFSTYVPFFINKDVEKLKKHLIFLMKSWYEAAITPRKSEWENILQRELASKQDMQSRLSFEAFIEWAIGAPYVPEPGERNVLLVPHISYRPWTIQANLSDAKVFYYPVSDESLFGLNDPFRPSASLVLLYRALGDENRLRILKLLHEKERTLQELTEILDLAKSTIHHHLALLRSARLVISNGTTYVLKPTTLQHAYKQLEAYFECNV